MLDVLTAHGEGMTHRAIRNEVKLSDKVLAEVLEKLVEEGHALGVNEKGKSGKVAVHFLLPPNRMTPRLRSEPSGHFFSLPDQRRLQFLYGSEIESGSYPEKTPITQRPTNVSPCRASGGSLRS